MEITIPDESQDVQLTRVPIVQRMTPSQSWKSSIIAIGCYPLAARFDCQRGKISIRDKIAPRIRILRKVDENLPMTWTRLNHHAIGAIANLLGNRNCVGQRRR